jgi:hypothetical protein
LASTFISLPGIKDIITDDGRGNKAIRVVISAENRPPNNILLSNDTILDRSISGEEVGIVTVEDPNRNEYHFISIVDDPDDKFDIENPQTAPGDLNSQPQIL